MAYGSEQRNRHLFRWLLVTTSVAALGSSCVLDRSGLQGGSGGAGGATTCVSGSECPDDDPCGVPACIDSACGYTPEPVGTVCSDAMDRICNAVGQCVAPEAYPCADDPGVCPDGFPCVDGVCCNNSCEGPCEVCNLGDSPGICTPLQGGSNPDGNCIEGVCDGGGDCAVGAQDWQLLAAANGEQYILDMATGPDGAVYLVGAFTETMPIPGGGPTLTVAGGRNGVLFKLNSAGVYQWHHHFQTAQGTVSGIDVRDNEVFVTGWFSNSVTVNSMTYNGTGADVFVAKLNDAGMFDWLNTFGGDGQDYARRLTLTGDGEVVMAGVNAGGMFDGNTNQGADDAFLLKLNNDGTQLWLRWFGGAGDQVIWGVDGNDEGEVAIAGMTNDTFDAGSTTLTPAPEMGANDIWAARILSNGTTLWARLFGGTGNDEARVARFGDNGRIWIGGSFFAAIDFSPTIQWNATGELEAFFLELDSGGTPARGVHFGEADERDVLWEAERTTNGGWVLGGSHEKELMWSSVINFEDNGGNYDAFVIKVSPDLEPLWGHAISSNGQPDYLQALAIDPDNNVLLAANPGEDFDWFGQNQGWINSSECFIAKLSP